MTFPYHYIVTRQDAFHLTLDLAMHGDILYIMDSNAIYMYKVNITPYIYMYIVCMKC